MNLFELFVKIGVDDQASGKLGELGKKLGNGLKTAAKIGTAAVATAATGIAALTTAAVNNYAEYEQLVGGVDTLFKSSSQKVQEYAANAYKTAGMSANEYMSTVTSFSASLLQSLGGDTDKAAEYANQALTDMSDNANKMGTDIGMIQNAYQGFAKQNYTMLDNLKLGYGGTAQEMYRLLERAAELDETFAKTANFSIDSKGHLEAEFDDITQAIHIVQTEMGITGTTADEAGRTISGSVGSMKSAWANLITGLADGNADIGQLVDNLITTIVGDGTEKNLGVLGNIMPAVKTALGGAAKLVSKTIPELGKQLPGLIGDFLPMLLDSAVGLLNGLAKSFPELLPILIDAIILSAPAIIGGIVTVFESIVGALPELIQQISDALPTLVPQIVVGLGLMAVALARQLPEIFASLVDGLINLFAGAWDGIQQVFSLDVVQDFFSDVWDGIKKAFGAVGDWFRNIFSDAWEGVKNVFSSGGKIFQGITDGISGAFKIVVNAIIKGINNVVAWPFDKINGFLNKIRNVSFLGISPFKGFWKQNPLPVPQIPLLARGGVLEKGQVGLLEGTGAEAVVPLENNQKWISKVADDLKKSVGGFGGNVYNVEINIDGAKYSDEQSLARAVAEAIQSMTDRRAAVYA